MDIEILKALPVWYAAFLFSVTSHEAAHAWAAKKGGDLTAYLGGQVSLDPRPHIRREPLGLVIFPLLTFFLNGGGWMMGWASAPYNSLWADRYPRRAFGMSMAGPLTNVAIALAAAVGLRTLVAGGLAGYRADAPLPFIFDGNGGWSILAGFLYLLVYLNVLLALFNLIPVPPLDGFAVFRLLLNRASFGQLAQTGAQFGLIGLLVAWYLLPKIFHPVMWVVHKAVVGDVPPPLDG